MTIRLRMYTAVALGILGVLLFSSLALADRSTGVAQLAMLIVAVVSIACAVALAWRVARDTYRLVELPAIAHGPATGDDTDGTVLRPQSRDCAAESARRTEEYATLIADAAAAARRRMDEARTPVHILLSNQFGELNENQEEMLGAAESAMLSLEEELVKLERIADIDRGALKVRRESVHIRDLLLALCPMLSAQAEKEGVGLVFDLEPALPRVVADAVRLHDALRLALTDDVRYAVPGSTVTVQARSSLESVTVLVQHGSRHSYAGNILLAARLIGAQNGSLEHADGFTIITMPRAQTPACGAGVAAS